MKFFHEFVGLFTSIVSVVAISREVYYAVSPSKGSENFYLKLKSLEAVEELIYIKEHFICSAILESPFFSTVNNVKIVEVSPNGELYDHFHPELDWSWYTKPYKSFNITVLQNVTEEYMFPCVAQTKEMQELKLYLISHEYNFNRWMKRSMPTKFPLTHGRFVFEYNESRKMADLIAVADEPAVLLDYVPVNSSQCSDLRKDLSAIDERGHKICEFTIGRKLRICAIALNAQDNRNEIWFEPLENSIEPECEKKELEFGHWMCKPNSTFIFNQWVIGCKAKSVEQIGDSTISCYVSIGYEPYQFLMYAPFLSKHGDEGAELQNHFYSPLGLNNADYSPSDGLIRYEL